MHALLHSVPQPCSRPPLTHASMETSGHSQVSLGQSLVGSLLLSPGSWCTKFCLCPPWVYFPTLCKFWCLYGGVNGLQEVLCRTQGCWARAPVPAAARCWPVSPQEMLKHSSVSVSVQSLGPVHRKLIWGLWESLEGMEFNSKCKFSPSYDLNRASPLPLDVRDLLMASPAKCHHHSWPWMWGISSQPIPIPSPCQPFQYSALRTPWAVWKGKKTGHRKLNSPSQKVLNMLLEISGKITPERMKRWSQSKNNTQLRMWLVIEARSDALKSNIS